MGFNLVGALLFVSPWLALGYEMELQDPNWAHHVEYVERMVTQLEESEPGCWRTAVNLFGERSCADLNDESSLGLLALAFTECHLKAAGRRPLSSACARSMRVDSCTSTMNSEEFGVYTTFFTQTPALCYYIRGVAFRDDAREYIGKLLKATADAAQQLKKQAILQDELRNAAGSLLRTHGQLSQGLHELALAAEAAQARSLEQQQQLITEHKSSIDRVALLQREILAATQSTSLLSQSMKAAAVTCVVLVAAIVTPPVVLVSGGIVYYVGTHLINAVLHYCASTSGWTAAASVSSWWPPRPLALLLCEPVHAIWGQSFPALGIATLVHHKELIGIFVLLAAVRSVLWLVTGLGMGKCFGSRHTGSDPLAQRHLNAMQLQIIEMNNLLRRLHLDILEHCGRRAHNFAREASHMAIQPGHMAECDVHRLCRNAAQSTTYNEMLIDAAPSRVQPHRAAKSASSQRTPWSRRRSTRN